MRFCTVHTHSLLCDGKNTLEVMARAAFAAGVVSFGARVTATPTYPGTRQRAAGGSGQLPGGGSAAPGDLSGTDGGAAGHRAGQPVCPAGAGLGGVLDRFGSQSARLPDRLILLRGLGCGAPEDLLGRCSVETLWLWSGGTMPTWPPWRSGSHHPGSPGPDREAEPDGCFFNEEDPAYQAAALEALHAADPDATLLEINTGAMSRGYRDTPYPALFLLREWRAMGGRIILTADAHRASAIVWAYGPGGGAGPGRGFREHTLLTCRGPVPDLL